MQGGWIAAAGTHRFIGNRRVQARCGQPIDVIDPSDGRPFAKIARGDAADIDAAVSAARRAYGECGEGAWGGSPRPNAGGCSRGFRRPCSIISKSWRGWSRARPASR